MSQVYLVGFSSILVLGILAQWLAWRLAIPSILLLLGIGFLVGPVLGLLDPNLLFGESLFSLVSIAVGIILFEGGLSLPISELRAIGRPVFNLVAIGSLVSWALSSIAAHWILGWDWSLSLLLGSILVVTGPTVIGPLLLQIRPSGDSGPTLKWESILIDPVGATLAVLVFEAVFIAQQGSRGELVLLGVLKTLVVGCGIGLVFAAVLYYFLRRYWIPDYLQNAASLMLVVAAFCLANLLQHEAGLLATTVMGLLLVNQKKVSIRHIIEFKEDLRVLLISGLFIVLTARLKLEELEAITWASLAFPLVLILFIRPLSVFASALGTGLSRKDRLFISWMAPRGIVAAAVAAIFAEELKHMGLDGAEELVAITFLVIACTVGLYGLTASRMARRLGLSDANPQGMVLLGVHPLSTAIARQLVELDVPVLLVDNNYSHVAEAKMEGLPAHFGDVLSERILEHLPLGGIGKFLGMTPNNQVNALAALHFGEVFGRANAFQLPPTPAAKGLKDSEVPRHLRGRFLFGESTHFPFFRKAFEQGATLKRTKLTEEFGFQELQEQYGEELLPLFLIEESGLIQVYTSGSQPLPEPGQILVSLLRTPAVHQVEESTARAEPSDA